ncbi:uncharacterized protein YdbL (DUF1318 family) [Endobacter medicaginis]|uniref:Terminase small subunit n=1 Tax=Endobacter medicaginis TaxID=1181271 RepID=A0A850NRD3_9PROT|nr:terminase small subunit [Endobacter medicaginis]MBB3175477.1 uncharacterized protein YdbL (DUF1318 family) [Endobacter medicaginis]MCX5477132.1 terminase small subunit [Endobacter medicaginis]NVN29815.1 terminase small subunit [Endobacter medicaginis]
MALNLRQQRFVEAYLASTNAAEAAKAAGYAGSQAKNTGYRLLQNTDIKAAIDQARAASAARAAAIAERSLDMKERIVRELSRIAFADPRRLSSWGPGGLALHESHDIDAEDAAVVSEITESRQGRETKVALKTHNKLQALTLLAKIHGLTDRKEPDAADTSTVDIADDQDPDIDGDEEQPAVHTT